MSKLFNLTENRIRSLEHAIATRVQPEQTNLDRSLSFPEFCLNCETRTGQGIRPIELWDFQRCLAELLLYRKRVVLAKSRQCGLSTFALLFCAWYLICQRPGLSAIYVCKDGTMALNMGRKFRSLLQNQPEALVNDALSVALFRNGSELHFRSCSPEESVGRSLDAVGLAILDETAFWQADPKIVLESLTPCFSAVGSDAILLQLSTPNGLGDFYFGCVTEQIEPDAFNILTEAIARGEEPPYQEFGADNDIGWGLALVHWLAVPNYRDESDFLGRIKRQYGLTDAAIAREFQLRFEEPAEALFSFGLLQDSTAPLPEWGDSYAVRVMGIDPASTGKDYFAAVVLRQFEESWFPEVIYRRRSGTIEQHLLKVNQMILELEPEKIVIESNSLGQFCFEALASRDYGYKVEAFTTSRQSKDALIGRAIYGLESGLAKLTDGSIITKELAAFRRNEDGSTGVPEHVGHDDAAVAWMLALHGANVGSQMEIFS